LLDALPGLECDDGLETLRGAAVEAPLALGLARHLDQVDLGDVDFEDGLDGLFDLHAVGLRVHEEGVLARFDRRDGLLRQYGGEDHVVGVHAVSPPSSKRSASAMTLSDRRMS